MLLLLAQQLAEHLGFRGNELDEEGVCEEADGHPYIAAIHGTRELSVY